jgi:putative transposase
LLAAPPAAGELQAALSTLAAKTWRHPISGLDVCFGAVDAGALVLRGTRAADPVAASQRPAARQHRPLPQPPPAAIESWRPVPRASRLDRATALRQPARRLAGSDTLLPSYPTVRRYLKAQGMFRQAAQTRHRRRVAGPRPARTAGGQELRGRSRVGALAPRFPSRSNARCSRAPGAWVKPLLLGVIDDRSRLVCHLQWYLDETAESLVHGLSQAFMKRGLPRALMTDNGAAMLADETVSGLAPGDRASDDAAVFAYQNAKQESFWGRVEGRLMAMLEGEESLTLDLLNQATQAWVEQEYHRTLHSEIETTPLARYLAGPNVSVATARIRRNCAAAFPHRGARRQRRSDGTVSLAGAALRGPARYRHLPWCTCATPAGI